MDCCDAVDVVVPVVGGGGVVEVGSVPVGGGGDGALIPIVDNFSVSNKEPLKLIFLKSNLKSYILLS